MSPMRRELLNGLFVLVVASLISAAFAAFQVTFNVLLWVLILLGLAVAVGFYVLFEITLSVMASAEDREKEWLKRVGTPARLELGPERQGGLTAIVEAVKAMSPGSDYTAIWYYGPRGGEESPLGIEREHIVANFYDSLREWAEQGKFRQYKRIICFDHDVLANDHELRSGVLRVGEGPGTIGRAMGEHCRLMMRTKGCSLYVAPVVFRSVVVFFGADKVCITVETAAPDTGDRTTAGLIFFSDPPNGEMIEQFRQIERATERHMVAVHKIRFPEDA